MKQIKAFLLTLVISPVAFGQYDGNTSPTYDELIRVYRELDEKYAEIELYAMGPSDYGLPIYVCILNGKQDSLSTFGNARKGTTLLINNAIHPGEPDGVNACLLWIQDWIAQGLPTEGMPTIAIIPAYNVGGMMNRSGTSRANQDGPEEYGFRGNAQNLDLNRDFIKSDSKNMFTFAKIYQALDPDVFLDTHVSNGADYQYTMTYIASVRERMAPSVAALMHDEMIPWLSERSVENGFELCPYVHTKGETPETGLEVFNDLPRYAMGYASVFGALSFTLETHMLKPFPQRVQATRVFISETIQWMKDNTEKIEIARKEGQKWRYRQQWFRYNYHLLDQHVPLLFKGYEYSNPQSEVTGLARLKYHQDKPFEKEVPYFKFYVPGDSVLVPDAIVLGGQCEEIAERMLANGVQMYQFRQARPFNSSVFTIQQARIEQTENGNRPYEGHFLHQHTKVDWVEKETTFKPDDWYISLDQDRRNFILQVLQPDAPDSYFAWNFFDSYLQQKEYFSPYVFEDMAADLLKKNPELKREFEAKKAADEDFSKSSWDQLYFIYTKSPYYEPSHNFLPLFYLYNDRE